jgi:Winged helix DNA-binding domain
VANDDRDPVVADDPVRCNRRVATADPPSLTWPQVLAWRLRRQWVDPVGDGSVVEIVRRLGGVQAQVASAAELAIAVRQRERSAGQVDHALTEERSLIRTWAMRGTLHLLPADAVGDYLALAGAHRWWEKASWQKTFGATPADLEAIAAAATEALDATEVLSREELTQEIVERTGSTHLREVLGSGWGTLLKPLAWWGVLCHGPARANRVTFTSPRHWVSGWREPPDPDVAAPVVLRAYLRAHGPGTPDTFDAWLSRSTTRRGELKSWFAALADDLVTVDVEGTPMQILADDVDELAATKPTKAVRLLGGFDQYVLGAGTNAAYLVPPEHRAEVSRSGGWISPVVLRGGRVVGTWQADAAIDVTLWDDVPASALKRETTRMRKLLDGTP